MGDSPEHSRLQRLLELAWNAFPMAAVVVDQDGTIRHCSDQTNYLLGYEPGRLVGTHMEHIMGRHDRGSDGTNGQWSMEDRTLGGDLELSLRKQDGTTFPVRLSLTQISELEGSDEIWTLVLMQDQRPVKQKDQNSRAEKRYWQLFNQNQVGLIWARPGGKVLSCNPAAARMFGYESPDRFEGQSFSDHYRGESDERQATIDQLRTKGEISKWNVPMKQQDGTPFTVLESLVLVEQSEYEGPVVVSSVVEVTQQARLWEELKQMAYHDPLTGLPNRRFLEEQAPKVFSLADRRDRYAGVAYVDLDGFKAVNDEWGHETGDEVLVSIAERLERTTRKGDVLARIGGDEFAVLWADLDAPENALDATRRIVRIFDEPFSIGEKRSFLDMSAGIAAFPTHGDDVDELLRRADKAMYRAKQEGKNMVMTGEAQELS